MPRKGFAASLPKDLREELDRQILDGRRSVDDLWAWLKDEGVEVGRSSVGRHKQTVEETTAQLREAREAAAAIVQTLGPDAAEGKLGQLLIEVTQNIAFKLARSQLTKEGGPDLDMEQLMFLSSTIQKLTSAQATDQGRLAKARAEALKSAASAAQKVAKAGGLSKDLVDTIVHAVLGVDG